MDHGSTLTDNIFIIFCESLNFMGGYFRGLFKFYRFVGTKFHVFSYIQKVK